ncbi:DUF1015 domain-containing protein [Fusibacter paucivorans]|uniref:DUF1015 domain-containing protein n=1 Tax=Fusibacter paucivorans TaxID=76009 RepID=A0ABS5PQA4_9FIRM|nr:DUF1015 family protein [Fusibacter paucivorans]MBS7527353.1 DUF1015 domain-containing protein [Fusibacter paucivorans]
MAIVKPFEGIIPKASYAESVASLPYDVMNREEAKAMAAGNPLSFLHIVRSEIDLPEAVGAYEPAVYETARKNLDRFIEEGTLVKTDKPVYFIYRQIMNGRVQTGIVARNAIDDYLQDRIKKHEFTRPAKEEDRIRNFDTCEANTAPIFLTYRKDEIIQHIVNDWIKFHMPYVQFTSEDGIMHIIWIVDADETIQLITERFAAIDYLYIADGHHRSASAVKVGLKRRSENPNFSGEEPYNFFMSVIFPDEDLFIMDYNRVVADLNGYSDEAFLEAITQHFELVKADTRPYKPMKRSTFGMYLSGKWYTLCAKAGTYAADDPVERLDVSILQNNLLKPILGIDDPRTDERIDFIGGIRGLDELEKRVDTMGFKVAFSMYPTTMDDLIDIANAGAVMPPKSTWFEPKLRSGLFVHRLF